MTSPLRPRVLVITPVFPPAKGGIETLTHELVGALHDCEVLVLTAAQEGDTKWDATSPIDVQRVVNVPRGGRKTQLRLSALAVRKARAFRPTIVLSMHVRCGAAAHVVRLLTRCRWVQYYHAKEVSIWRRQSAWCAGRADVHIAVSRYTADLVAAAGAARADIEIVPPGVHLPLGNPELRRPGRPILVSVSRLEDHYKGHDVVLEAMPEIMRRVPHVMWEIVGDGRLRKALEERADQLQLGGVVRFLGALDDASRDTLLSSASVFVLPSRIPDDGLGGEGFGITYIEAASRGLPVVAAAEGGALDAVADGFSGLLVNPRDPSAVASAVSDLLCDEELRLAMAKEAVAWAQNFSWDEVTHRARAAILLHAATPEEKSA